jgi:hypothetical protein
MAHLEVKRKSHSSLWHWLIIIIIVIAAVAFWYTRYYQPTAMVINDTGMSAANIRAATPLLINHLL